MDKIEEITKIEHLAHGITCIKGMIDSLNDTDKLKIKTDYRDWRFDSRNETFKKIKHILLIDLTKEMIADEEKLKSLMAKLSPDLRNTDELEE